MARPGRASLLTLTHFYRGRPMVWVEATDLETLNLIHFYRGRTVVAAVSVQTLRPIADVSSGGWTPSTGIDLYAMLDETSADDADYDSTATESSMTVQLGVGSAPAVDTGHIVRYRIKGTGIITVELLQASTVIASWDHNPAPTSYTTYEQTLTELEASAISDYADLRLKVSASAT